jgi:hypothetical protein
MNLIAFRQKREGYRIHLDALWSGMLGTPVVGSPTIERCHATWIQRHKSKVLKYSWKQPAQAALIFVWCLCDSDSIEVYTILCVQLSALHRNSTEGVAAARGAISTTSTSPVGRRKSSRFEAGTISASGKGRGKVELSD